MHSSLVRHMVYEVISASMATLWRGGGGRQTVLLYTLHYSLPVSLSLHLSTGKAAGGWWWGGGGCWQMGEEGMYMCGDGCERKGCASVVTGVRRRKECAYVVMGVTGRSVHVW